MKTKNQNHPSEVPGADTRTFYKRQRAEKRVEQIKGFRIHLGVYLILNALILLGIALASAHQGEPLFRAPSLWTPGLWGLGLAFHAFRVFGLQKVLGSKWEAQQLKKILEEEVQQADAFIKNERYE